MKRYDFNVVGKSSDGGIDVIVLDSDEPMLVQVKRRTKKGSTEAVKEIRDLIGASVIESRRRLMFVTTADKFSRDAIEARNTVIENGAVEEFELIDFEKFAGLLQLNREEKRPPWSDVIRR